METEMIDCTFLHEKVFYNKKTDHQIIDIKMVMETMESSVKSSIFAR